MGSHSEVEQPPPPKNKPRYRFVVAICGIIALAFIAMAVVAAVFPEKTPAVAGPDDTSTAANPFPPLPTVDPNTQSPGVPTGSPPATTTPGPTTAAPRTTTQPPTNPTTTATGPAGAVFAAYSLVPGEDYGTSFHGQVTLTNTTNVAQNWVVRIVFPDSVTPTQTRWIDGMETPDIATESHGATYIGKAKIGAGQTVVLKFEFQKAPGPVNPTICSINGHDCSLS